MVGRKCSCCGTTVVVDLVKRLKLGNNLIELITMDILALESMKNAAKCDK